MSARFGRYELLRPLGRGGMAEVFLARYLGPEGFEKRLVIKRVLPQLSDDRRLLRMFFEEARTQVSLSHGNLVSVFDFGRVANEYFIAMEHVEGADLATVVAGERAAGRGLPAPLVAHVGVELCRALAYVHRRGFVHRDLTPRNVLISRDGEVKLSDFGVALAVTNEADPGLRGTLAYMAPEQARGGRVDGRADLFALGYALAEALEGRLLRKTTTDDEALAVARAGAPVRLEGPLGALLGRATETAVEARFASADEMLAALELAAAGLGGGRERSVRELAALVPETSINRPAPDRSPTPSPRPSFPDGATAAATLNLRAERATEGATVDGDASAETYFRDNRSPTFVEEVLGSQTPRPAAPRRRLQRGLAAGFALLAAAGVASVVTRRAPTPPTVAPPPVAVERPAAPSVPPPAPPAAPVVAAPAPARRRAPARRAPPAQNGQLVIQCTPWCVPSVDGEPRGKDGRHFPLVLPVGAHLVEVRRLEDRQRREVKVAPGDPQVLKFTFE